MSPLLGGDGEVDSQQVQAGKVDRGNAGSYQVRSRQVLRLPDRRDARRRRRRSRTRRRSGARPRPMEGFATGLTFPHDGVRRSAGPPHGILSPMKLPVVADAATAACAGCSGPCCLEHDVEVNGFDLVRLGRGLGLPWDALVHDAWSSRTRSTSAFWLDRGPVRHHHFQLRRRDSGACPVPCWSSTAVGAAAAPCMACGRAPAAPIRSVLTPATKTDPSSVRTWCARPIGCQLYDVRAALRLASAGRRGRSGRGAVAARAGERWDERARARCRWVRRCRWPRSSAGCTRCTRHWSRCDSRPRAATGSSTPTRSSISSHFEIPASGDRFIAPRRNHSCVGHPARPLFSPLH